MVETGTATDLLRWIPLLPLLGALVHGVGLGLLRRAMPKPLVIARLRRRPGRSHSSSPAWPSRSCSRCPASTRRSSIRSTPGSAPVASRADLGLLLRRALRGDEPDRHGRRLADPRLLDRLHGRRPPRRRRLPALLRLPEPVPVLDAAARPRRQPARALPRLGGRRALLVPADRLLVRRPLERLLRHEGLRRQPHRRLRLPARDLPAVLVARRRRDAELRRAEGGAAAHRRADRDGPGAGCRAAPSGGSPR